MDNDWKSRLGTVYSTNEKFNYEHEGDEEQDTLPPNEQQLSVTIDKKQRKGKTATLICGFVGTNDDLLALGKLLKTKCGVGGSAKEGEILIQGDKKARVLEVLKDLGYSAK